MRQEVASMNSPKMKKRYEKYACPICGELPKIHALYDDGDKRPGKRPDDWNEYKVSCPNHHLDCGDWKNSKLGAWKDWLKRRKDVHQPDFCFNDNDFTIKNMSLDELADFLFRWHRNAVEVMCKDHKTGCAFSCRHNEECGESIPGVPTVNTIKAWLQKPVDGLYPKGYPDIPAELQSQDADIYGYRKRQAKHKI